MSYRKNIQCFLVADKRLYKRLCPSVRPSVGWLVGWLVRHARVEKWENTHFRPCPPVRDWYWPCIRPCSFSSSSFSSSSVIRCQLVSQSMQHMTSSQSFIERISAVKLMKKMAAKFLRVVMMITSVILNLGFVKKSPFSLFPHNF